ncbi:MAG: hypothetical protein QNK37_35720 [Acidobacteriota bacterium]|nr:hypothetical protein [Acidobacteriota bacterium]
MTWLSPKKRQYGLDFVDPFGRVKQKIDTLSWWFFELHGKLYGSGLIWAPGETQVVPIEVEGGRLGYSEVRKDFFDLGECKITMDTDFKRVWPVETPDGVLLATPLDPVIHKFKGLGFSPAEYTGSEKLPYPQWRSYPGRWDRKQRRRAYLKRFDRLTWFGDTDNGLCAAVETSEHTLLVWFNGKSLAVDAWQADRHLIGGSDGAKIWVFKPGHKAIYTP